MAWIQPDRIGTSGELAEQLALLFDRDFRGMQVLAADAGLSAATVYALITGATAIPRVRTLERFVEACGQQSGPWLAARARLVAAARADRASRADRAPDSARPDAEPLGRMIGELSERDALALEVHQAFAVAQTAAELVPVLPLYLPRAEFDELLRAELASAVHSSRLVMVVGGSSTGKTRACWEAIRAVLPNWRVWHPLTPERPMAVVEALHSGRVVARSVIWLNEAQFYLQAPQAGESVATALQALLADVSRGPVLVLGSMWPDYWELLTREPDDAAGYDPHQAARALLDGAAEITTPQRFTDRQLADLTEAVSADPRLRAAVQRAPGGHITQELAGAPELLRRYRQADAAEQAVLWAAMDARRLGHGPYLTQAFLQHAAPGYLDDDAWDQIGGADWFTVAVDRLTAKHRRLPGPLIRHYPRPGEPPFPQPLYRLADFLEQHGRHERALLCPPSAFWDAATHHAHTSVDLTALADAARERGRDRYASRLARRAADFGDTGAMVRLAWRREEAGDRGGAERLIRQAADAGNADALVWLAQRQEEAGGWDGAERLYRQAADAGETYGLLMLARVREVGDRDGAERVYRQVADAGNTDAMVRLARMREEAGDWDGAEGLYQQAADAGETYGLLMLAQRQEEAGGWDDAEDMYRRAADAGNTDAMVRLAQKQKKAGDRDGAERLIRQAANVGNTTALLMLALLREEAGDWDEAEALYRQAADVDTEALGILARMREEAGDRDGAEWLARQAAEADHPELLGMLARMREAAGDRDGAEGLYRQAADASATAAMLRLALQREAGDRDGAESLCRQAADVGEADALMQLARMREEAGDQGSAERLARQAADAGRSEVLGMLARMREAVGDWDGAEGLYRQAADAGENHAVEGLARMREKAGDRDGAERLVRFGLTAEGEIEAPWSW